MAFQGSAKKEQSRLSRAIPRRFGNFPGEELTDDEYRKLLKEKCANLETKLFLMKDKNSPERKEIVNTKQLLSEELWALNGRKKKLGTSALSNKFMDVCRKKFSKETFDYLLTLANQELEKEKSP